MPLPALLIPLAIAGGSAVAQAAAKLKSHERLNALQSELQELESLHRDEMLQHYERHIVLCHRLSLPGPELPASLQEHEEPPPPPPIWQRLLRRRKRTVADGSPHSRASIIGRQGAGFVAGTVWKAWSATIMNLLRPITAKLLTLFPGAAPAIGTGSSLVFGVSLRFALGVVSVAAIVIGPLLLVWAVVREVRKVRKARRELETIRNLRRTELASYAALTRQLQWQARRPVYPGCRVGTKVRSATPYSPHQRRTTRPVRAAHPGGRPQSDHSSRTASAA
ncbi:MAG: hypothetical protein OXL97_02145 [Chloroflexota bacterium]|nr:hypothetical protein [Chloroflexota bacterium]MDE2884784.1 hypothetical protein [Chloroflexota bacterium]